MENAVARSEFENIATELGKSAEEEIFGEEVGIISGFFGCWHRRMSKPVTTKNVTYRYCPHCGIRRQYDLETFKSHGSFYYPSKNKNLYHV